MSDNIFGWTKTSDCRVPEEFQGFDIKPWIAFNSVENWGDNAVTPKGLADGDTGCYEEPYLSIEEIAICDSYGVCYDFYGTPCDSMGNPIEDDFEDEEGVNIDYLLYRNELQKKLDIWEDEECCCDCEMAILEHDYPVSNFSTEEKFIDENEGGDWNFEREDYYCEEEDFEIDEYSLCSLYSDNLHLLEKIPKRNMDKLSRDSKRDVRICSRGSHRNNCLQTYARRKQLRKTNSPNIKKMGQIMAAQIELEIEEYLEYADYFNSLR